MRKHPDLDDLARRPRRYWHVDGLPELMLGLTWMIWGTAWLIGQSVPHDWRATAYWLMVSPMLAVSGFVVHRITGRLKQRVTFPRAGYVEWARPSAAARTGVVAITVIGALAIAAVALFAPAAAVERRAPAIITAVLSLAFVALAVWNRAPHHFALAAATVAVGIAAATLATGWTSVHWLFLGVGLASAAIGVVRLVVFLRTHPAARAEAM